MAATAATARTWDELVAQVVYGLGEDLQKMLHDAGRTMVVLTLLGMCGSVGAPELLRRTPASSTAARCAARNKQRTGHGGAPWQGDAREGNESG